MTNAPAAESGATASAVAGSSSTTEEVENEAAETENEIEEVEAEDTTTAAATTAAAMRRRRQIVPIATLPAAVQAFCSENMIAPDECFEIAPLLGNDPATFPRCPVGTPIEMCRDLIDTALDQLADAAEAVGIQPISLPNPAPIPQPTQPAPQTTQAPVPHTGPTQPMPQPIFPIGTIPVAVQDFCLENFLPQDECLEIAPILARLDPADFPRCPAGTLPDVCMEIIDTALDQLADAAEHVGIPPIGGPSNPAPMPQPTQPPASQPTRAPVPVPTQPMPQPISPIGTIPVAVQAFCVENFIAPDECLEIAPVLGRLNPADFPQCPIGMLPDMCMEFIDTALDMLSDQAERLPVVGFPNPGPVPQPTQPAPQTSAGTTAPWEWVTVTGSTSALPTAPVSVPAVPTSAPAGTTSAPAGQTSAPAEPTSAPTGPTPAPPARRRRMANYNGMYGADPDMPDVYDTDWDNMAEYNEYPMNGARGQFYGDLDLTDFQEYQMMLEMMQNQRKRRNAMMMIDTDFADTMADNMADTAEAQADMQEYHLMQEYMNEMGNQYYPDMDLTDAQEYQMYMNMMNQRKRRNVNAMGGMGRFYFIDRKRRQAQQCDLFYMTFEDGTTSDYYPICDVAQIIPTLQEAQTVCVQ